MAFRYVSTFASAAVLFLLTAVSAMAATPTNDMYDPVDHKITSASSAGGSGSSLPFTGFELVALIVAGLIVIATGLLIRRASRTD